MMKISHFAAATAVVLLACTQGARLSAQEAPQAVPMDLVVALVSFPWASAVPEIAVGDIPRHAPRDLAPRIGRVLGGSTQGNHSVVILAFDMPSDSAIISYRRHLSATGWSERVESRHAPGFIDSRSGEVRSFCRDSLRVSLGLAAGATRGSHVSVNLLRAPREESCSEKRPLHDMRTELDIPSLKNPEGATVQSGGSGSSGDSWYASSQISSSLGAAELLDHYGKQLAAIGWTVGETIAGKGVALGVLEATDRNGNRWHGLLTILEVGGIRVAELRMGSETRRF